MKATGIVSRRIVGIPNQDITPEVSSTLGAALGTYLGSDSVVVTCRDFRSDSRMVKRSFASGLMSTGVDVLDLHASSVPVLQFALKRFGASAAVSFCGEHYLPEAIRLRIFDSAGAELGPENVPELIKSLKDESELRRVSGSAIGRILATEDTERIYRSALLNFVRRDRIRARNFKVVVDCALGASSLLFPSILSDLGVQVVTLNAYAPTHIPETLPSPTSLKTLEKTVVATNADLGIALDVEGSRLVLVDETGSLICPDLTTALYVSERCRKQPKGGTVIITDTTSAVVPEMVSDSRVERVHTIQPGTVARKIRNSRAFAGATDKGQLFFPSFIPESDAFLAVVWILEYLADNEMNLSEALAPFSAKTPAVSKETLIPEKDFGKTLQGLYTFCNAPSHEHGLFCIDSLCGVKIVYMEGLEGKKVPDGTERLKGWVQISPGRARLGSSFLNSLLMTLTINAEDIPK